MPTSHQFQLNEIVTLIMLADPSSLLDIGPGFGKFGFLAREYLELWNHDNKYNDWTRRIDAIEVFEGYITPVHEYIYDNIYIGDALDVLPSLSKQYELIMMIDVFEHFSFEDGQTILEHCEARGKNLLISVPKDIGIQGAAFGNEHETHKFQWEMKHFDQFENKFFVNNFASHIVFIGTDAQRVLKALQRGSMQA